MKVLSFSKLLIICSVILLVSTAYLVMSEGKLIYFLTFHKPFSLPVSAGSAPMRQTNTLPAFTVQSSTRSASLSTGATQVISVTVTARLTTNAFLEVWITAPSSKEVYKSPLSNSPTVFVANKPQTFHFSYQIPTSLNKGSYEVSDLITSSTMQTDYYVNEDFATFQIL